MPKPMEMDRRTGAERETEHFVSRNLDLLVHWSDSLSLRTIEEMEISGMQLGNGYFMLGLVHIADSQSRSSGQYLGNHYNAAEVQMQREFGARFLCHVGMVGGGVVILFCFPHCTDADGPEFQEVYETCRGFADRLELPCRFTFLLSQPFRGYRAIQANYSQLEAQLRYLLFMGSQASFVQRTAPRRTANPEYADNDHMQHLAEQMVTAIGHRQTRELEALETETLEALFSGQSESFQPVHFRLYVFLCALLKALETYHIVGRRFTRRQDLFHPLTSAPSYPSFCSRFHEMLQTIRQQYEAQLNSQNPAVRLQKIKDYCDGHFLDHGLTVSALAEQFDMAQSQLSASFKRQYGVNLLAYLNDLRINAAKELLRSTELSQREIAISCGFSNVTTMQRLFAKHAHCTPGQYRRSSAPS